MIIKRLTSIIVNFSILFFTLLTIDNLILFSSTKLPWNLVKTLSQKAQYNYKIKNGSKGVFDYQEYIYTLKANKKIPHLSDGKKVEYISDENGYLNPKDYLKENSNLDFLIVGDSYAAYPEYSKYLKNSTNKSVYSIAMGGQGIVHWQFQLERFNLINKKKTYPKNIIFNFYENDLDDTLRAVKYFEKGYTHSIYYPMNRYSDYLEKIDRKFSFFNEYYSIIRYIVVTTKIREKFNKLFINKENNLNDQYTFILSSDKCQIQFENPFEKSKEYFSEENKKIFKNAINNALNKVDFNKTKVYFVYIPSPNVIYSQKYQKNSILKNAFNTHEKTNNFLKKIFNNSRYKVNYINFSDDLIKLGLDNNLHPCNGKDSHFSHNGFKTFIKLLVSKLN